jgi:hypothetical protein
MFAVRATLAAALLAAAAPAFADDRDARQVIEGYVAAALEGKADAAAALAEEGQSPSREKSINELKEMLGVKALKLVTVHASDGKGRAIAVSEGVKLAQANPDGRDKGLLVFELKKTDKGWLVRDIDFRTEDRAKEQVKQFLEKYADAKELPAKPAK